MAKICMNEACQATSSFDWKKGWELKSGGSATLCYNCGSAYENSLYCQRFHLEESGWRECRLCGKRVHCGCIASKYLHDYLDYGGIGCITCIRNLETLLPGPIQIPNDDISKGLSPLAGSISDLQSSAENRRHGINGDKGKLMQFAPNETRVDGVILNKERLMQLAETVNGKELSESAHVKKGDATASIAQHKPEIMFPTQFRAGFPGLSQQPLELSMFGNSEIRRPMEGGKVMHEPIAQPSLSFSLKPFPLGNRNSLGLSPGGVEAGREQNIVPTFQQDQRARQLLPKPSNLGVTIALEANKELDSESRHFLPKSSKANLTSSEVNNGIDSEPRIARPPAEGRGRNQLLPRYWPRMTDQELQKISGDLNSKVVPLFEKVLSASDAGRIGRLVLPKACAEAYFPPIYQSDGLPIKIQDVKGREWTFQFRFWPNNNSRMYVLEGVTPCIQNMQLQAGDTVIFSRIDPGGKLVMGFRKSSNSVEVQDVQASNVPNEAPSGETSRSGFNDNLSTVGDRLNEGSSQRPPAEKKNARNIGSKSKRLLMNNEDMKGLRLTWKEAQELLRAPLSTKPTIVTVEGTEIEEYDEPPVFGKKTIFTAGADGVPEQWTQCDSCSKWRKLPVDVLVPSKWTCLDNTWDSSRCSCAAPDEMNPVEMDSLIGVGKDHKKRKIRDNSPKVIQEDGPSGLDALATAAILGDSAAETSVATTTRHPRHRPGCTCIVCIQPPSGKGKHKPSCVCVVCSTVKRRFKTLMLRKIKKNQVEDVPDSNPKDDSLPKTNPELEDERSSQPLDLNINPSSEDAHVPPANSAPAAETADSRQNVVGILRPCSASNRDVPADEGSVSSLAGEREHEQNNDRKEG